MLEKEPSFRINAKEILEFICFKNTLCSSSFLKSAEDKEMCLSKKFKEE